MEKMDVDLVYLWVDGNDPVWQAKHAAFAGKMSEDSDMNCKGRYVSNDELKYSLRSVEMYAPWIRKIFIVTDNQVPEWLNTSNLKIQIVDHKEIMPEESLPCFNSSLIEHFLYRIPGLAEHFLFSNDDMFINRKVAVSDFFTPVGFPIVRFTRKPFRRIRWFWRVKVRGKQLNNYRKMLVRSSQLVHKKYGKYYTGIPHHNIDAYLKSDYQRIVEVVFRDEFSANNKNRLRNDDDVHRSVLSYASLAEKRGQLRYVIGEESMYVRIESEKHYALLEERNPMFFCMNDSHLPTDGDRMREKVFLENYFPKKSSFEK